MWCVCVAAATRSCSAPSPRKALLAMRLIPDHRAGPRNFILPVPAFGCAAASSSFSLLSLFLTGPAARPCPPVLLLELPEQVAPPPSHRPHTTSESRPATYAQWGSTSENPRWWMVYFAHPDHLCTIPKPLRGSSIVTARSAPAAPSNPPCALHQARSNTGEPPGAMDVRWIRPPREPWRTSHKETWCPSAHATTSSNPPCPHSPRGRSTSAEGGCSVCTARMRRSPW
mmetsp:Transcript_12948/g.35262  ORF Transcript_12948/g.35262 Transcript_12948/m.35262 type:complete len:228 (-) Transcript_12948:744-1427(-)